MNSMMSRISPSAANMIRMDHTHVLASFHQYSPDSRPQTRKALANSICLALEIHAQLEEELFYPAARRAIQEPRLLDQALEDHGRAKELIAQLVDASAGDALFNTRVRLLRDAIEQHVAQEESELFPQVGRTQLDLQAMVPKMAARKEEILEVKRPEVAR